MTFAKPWGGRPLKQLQLVARQAQTAEALAQGFAELGAALYRRQTVILAPAFVADMGKSQTAWRHELQTPDMNPHVAVQVPPGSEAGVMASVPLEKTATAGGGVRLRRVRLIYRITNAGDLTLAVRVQAVDLGDGYTVAGGGQDPNRRQTYATTATGVPTATGEHAWEVVYPDDASEDETVADRGWYIHVEAANPGAGSTTPVFMLYGAVVEWAPVNPPVAVVA